MDEHMLEKLHEFEPNCTELGVNTDVLGGPAYVIFVDLIAGLGLIGNVCCFMLMMSRDLRHLSYSVFLRVLPVTDSIVLVFTATEDTLDILGTHDDLQSNRAGFQVWSVLLSLARVASPWLMACLAFNRLALILYTARLQRFTQPRAALLACLLVLAAALLLALPWDAFLPVQPGPYIRWAAASMLLFSSLLPCLAILVINVAIGVVLRRTLKRQAEETGVSRQKRRKVSRYTITIVALSFLTLACLLPKTLVEVVETLLLWSAGEGGLTGSSGYTLCLISKCWPVLNCLMLVNFAINFYALALNAHVRHTFLRQLLSCFRREAGSVLAEETAELIEKEDRGIALTPVMGFEIDSQSRDPE